MRQHIRALTIAIGILLVAGQGYTEDKTKTDPGSAQQAGAGNWRILWIGGYRQQGVYQGVKGDKDKADKHKRDAKDKADRERERRLEREQRAKDKAEAEKRRRQDQEDRRQDRLERSKQKKCRGIGIPAGCTEPNPGRSR